MNRAWRPFVVNDARTCAARMRAGSSWVFVGHLHEREPVVGPVRLGLLGYRHSCWQRRLTQAYTEFPTIGRTPIRMSRLKDDRIVCQHSDHIINTCYLSHHIHVLFVVLPLRLRTPRAQTQRFLLSVLSFVRYCCRSTSCSNIERPLAYFQCCCPWPWSLRCPRWQILGRWPWLWSSPCPWPTCPWPCKVCDLSDLYWDYTECDCLTAC